MSLSTSCVSFVQHSVLNIVFISSRMEDSPVEVLVLSARQTWPALRVVCASHAVAYQGFVVNVVLDAAICLA